MSETTLVPMRDMWEVSGKACARFFNSHPAEYIVRRHLDSPAHPARVSEPHSRHIASPCGAHLAASADHTPRCAGALSALDSHQANAAAACFSP